MNESGGVSTVELIQALKRALDALENVQVGAMNAGLFDGNSVDPDFYFDEIAAGIDVAKHCLKKAGEL